MFHRLRDPGYAAAILLLLVSGCAARPPETRAAERQFPLAMYLGWQNDASTTMTIHWHGLDPDEQTIVFYRPRGKAGPWARQPGRSHRLPYSERQVHVTELHGLRPGQEYEYRLGRDPQTWWFRTMPAEQPDTIRFIVGGDIYGDAARVAAMHQLAASLDPMFIIFGGDIAYADGKPKNLERWYTFFDLWQEHLVAPDGRQIPVIVAVGNHEVRRDLGVITSSPFFPNLFALPGGRSYYAIDFADYMSVVILDTDHLARVRGRQTRWLAQALDERQDVPHIFPAYHVPAYPSVRRLNARVNRQVRRHWVSLFEQAGVRFSFEHHDHSYKRTPPILGGRIHPEGIVFMGDGAWGVGTRPTRDPDQTWYLERAEPLRHLILVDLDREGIRITASEADGRIIDEYTRPHAPPVPTEQN